MGRLSSLVAGLLAGLVASLALLFVMAAARTWLGISPLPEAVPDRIAPTLDVDQFLQMLRDYGGYNELKKFGVRTGILGVVGAGVAAGLALGFIEATERARRGPRVLGLSRIGAAFLAGLALIIWGALVIGLWPVLGANFRGLPPGTARPLNIAALLIEFAGMATLIGLLYRFLTRRKVVAQDALPAGMPTLDPPALATRRAVVAAIAGAAVAAPTYILGRDLYDQATFPYDGTRYRGPDIQPVTPNDRFYVVTKNVVDPRVERDLWRLEVGGHVEEEHTYDIDDLTAMEAVRQETTLMCISNHVAAGLISNAFWTGVPMATLLERSRAKEGAVEVLLYGADGYTDTFSIERARSPVTLVVYRMNGEPLPQRHGYPVRIVVPGLYGEKNVKWVTRIEVLDHEGKGFYEQQGWGPRFEVPTRSDFFAPAVGGPGSAFRFTEPFRVGQEVTLRGRAFGGDRGVSRVEVSTDGGTSWAVAAIDYPGTKLTWVFWSFRWRPAQAGDYGLVVRAFDGNGDLQETEPRPTVREGLTGLHKVKATVSA